MMVTCNDVTYNNNFNSDNAITTVCMRGGDQSQADVSRRKVLQTTGGLAAAGGLAATGANPASGASGDLLTVNVGFEAGARKSAADFAAEVHREFAFNAMNIDITEADFQELQRRSDIRYVEIDGEMEAYGDEAPWGIERTESTVAHDNGYDGDGASIAVLDTGIDSQHPDLAPNLGEGKAFTECGDGFICWIMGNGHPCDHEWDDDHNHGTHCAGTADAAETGDGVIGVSTDASLHSVKVLDCMGSGDMSDVAAGLEWTADQGYDVASMSLGAPSESQAVSDAVEYAYDKGVLIVAAAGNDGECTDCVGHPAAHPKTVAVSATSEDDSMASFTSTGPEVDIAAPGEGVKSTVYEGHDTFSGTSMACPHVAGAAAQLISAGASRDEAEELLFATAEDLGHPETDQGHGLLNTWEALQALDDDPGGDGPTVAELLVSDLGDEVAVDGLIDAAKAGELEVTLSVTDEDGNSDSATEVV